MNFDKLLETVGEQNRYNNQEGQIPKDLFINRWHNLTNDDVMEIIMSAIAFYNANGLRNPKLISQIRTVSEYVLENQDLHPNCVNPPIAEHKEMQNRYGKRITKANTGREIKQEFFQMMRRITEMFNKEMRIDITNTDRDINRYALDWDGLDPEWPEAPTNFERNFEYGI